MTVSQEGQDWIPTKTALTPYGALQHHIQPSQRWLDIPWHHLHLLFNGPWDRTHDLTRESRSKEIVDLDPTDHWAMPPKSHTLDRANIARICHQVIAIQPMMPRSVNGHHHPQDAHPRRRLHRHHPTQNWMRAEERSTDMPTRIADWCSESARKKRRARAVTPPILPSGAEDPRARKIYAMPVDCGTLEA